MSNKKKKMIEDRFISRRQFLIGSGQAMLALPPLLSLMPKSVAAQVTGSKKVRSVVYFSYLGIEKTLFDPQNVSGLTKLSGAHETYYKALSSFSGPLSRMIDSSFQSLYPYMNVIKGLSMTGGVYSGHNTSILAGTHSQFRAPNFGRTVDAVMEKSSSVYAANEVIAHKAIRLSDFNGSSSFTTSGGSRTNASFIQGDRNLFNKLFANMPTGGGGGGPSQTDLNKELVVDRVYADLKNLENDARLSTEDKDLLQRYIAGVFDLQNKVKANNTGSGFTCSKPSLNLQATTNGNVWKFPTDVSGKWGISSVDAMFDNYIEMIKLAFACDLTRVVLIDNSMWSNVANNNQGAADLHHDCGGPTVSADRHQWGLKKMAKLAQALQGTADPVNGGKLLDNSSIMYTNELGDWTQGHSVLNMPVVTFGSGGGKIKTGYFVDYTNNATGGNINGSPTGRPYKQMLQMLMRSMGVSKSEYMQYGDGSGYGEFKENINQFGKNIPTAYSSYKSEHNDPLPFLSI